MDIIPIEGSPPSRRGQDNSRYDWGQVAATCDAAPGTWHLVLEAHSGSTLAARVNQDRNPRLPARTYEARSRVNRSTGARRHDIYVRRRP